MIPSISILRVGCYDDVIDLVALGDFRGAIATLGPEWLGPGVMPKRNSHDARSYATLLMVCGILTAEFGLMGSRLQEKSKDILSKSARLFGEGTEGAQCAQAWLATAYERCGDFRESLALSESLLQTKDAPLEITVCAAKTRAISLEGLGFGQQALDCLLSVTPLVEGVPPLLRGKFYLQRGKILRKLNRLDEALETYDLATECFYQVKSLRYEAAASNNIAGVYLDRNEFSRAHVLADKAVRLFHDLGDQNHEGMAWDQIAQIYRKEGKYHEAERAARTAVSLLERGDHLDFLAEALTTLGAVLVERGMSAIQPLQKAAEIYQQQNNQVQLSAVNGLMWDAVVRIKKLAKDTSAAMHKAVRPIEKIVIEQTLEKHHGHVSPAAKELGMTHRGLTEKIKQRFPELLTKCQPIKSRKRSIIKTK